MSTTQGPDTSRTAEAAEDIAPKGLVTQGAVATGEYLEERTKLGGFLGWFNFRKVPKEISWFQTLGFTAMVLFAMQAVTGIVLAMYYQPSPELAYDSIVNITDEVFWGWLVRGMHKWGASAMVIVVFLHMGRVFFFGAYKYPRELTWVTGALLLVMTMFMALTGYLLVWDQKAYWATVVAVNLTASAPILGPYIADILRAGPEFGPDTLSRFYSLHMLVIPGAIATFMAIHLYLIARLGITEPPYSKRLMKASRDEEEERRSAARERTPRGRRPVAPPVPERGRETVTAERGPATNGEGLVNRSQKQAYKQEYADAKRSGKPFFPYAVYKDLIIATIAVASVIAFAMIYRVEIGERVNPASTDFVPRPEWYFFFLFELLKIFKGQNAFTPVIMATFIIPNIMMALLILWPFLDPGPERRPHRRPIAMFVALGTIGFMGWLTFLASEAPGGTASAEDIQLSGLTPEAEAGLDLYLASGCTSCHMIQGIGAAGPGPDLTNEGQKNLGVQWQIDHLKNPQSKNPGSSMPAFTNFSDQEYQELGTFLNGLGTEFQ